MSFFEPSRFPSAWNPTRLILRGRLTDEKIEKYQKAGYYSPQYRRARFENATNKHQRREQARVKRSGNFDEIDGRMIYRP